MSIFRPVINSAVQSVFTPVFGRKSDSVFSIASLAPVVWYNDTSDFQTTGAAPANDTDPLTSVSNLGSGAAGVQADTLVSPSYRTTGGDERIEFNGVDQYIDTQTIPHATTGTLAVRCFIPDAPTGTEVIAGNRKSSSHYFGIALSPTHFTQRVGSGGFQAAPIITGAWVTLVSVWDNGARRFFVDGVKVADATYLGSVFPYNVYLGANNYQNTNAANYFGGDVSDFLLFDKALTDEQVQGLHDSVST